MNVVKVIRDPIHKYISLDEIELAIVETQYFQRLRYIKQNATAYLTYPCSVTSRFDHSLGVLHLAGEMIHSVLERSNIEDVNKFLSICRVDFGMDKKDRHDQYIVKDWQLREILISMVRLLGLVHDLGHLPFSHVGEQAIEWSKYLGLIYSG